MMGLGLPELAIILLIVVVIFGARKLPELGRGLGSGMREFKAGVTGQDDKPSAIDQPAQTAAPVQPPTATPVAEPVAEPVAPPAPAPAAEPVVPPAPAPAPVAEPQQPQRTEE